MGKGKKEKMMKSYTLMKMMDGKEEMMTTKKMKEKWNCLTNSCVAAIHGTNGTIIVL